MSLQKIPVFQPGNILTHEMLQLLREYAIDNAAVQWEGYSDGVLKGCHITTAPGILTVGKGIVLVKSKPFYIRTERTIRTESHDTEQMLVVRASEEEHCVDFIVREVELLLVSPENVLADDVELCRFRLQKGALLRSEYRDYKDMDTEYDTVCVKYAKWAAYGGESVSPEILDKFAEEAMRNKTEEPGDLQFLGRIAALNGVTLNPKELMLYLSRRLNRTYQSYDNREIYDGLSEVLTLMKKGRTASGQRRPETRRMIVD